MVLRPHIDLSDDCFVFGRAIDEGITAKLSVLNTNFVALLNLTFFQSAVFHDVIGDGLQPVE